MLTLATIKVNLKCRHSAAFVIFGAEITKIGNIISHLKRILTYPFFYYIEFLFLFFVIILFGLRLGL